MSFTAYADGRFDLDGQWTRCALGSGGVVAAKRKREGDGKSPVGAWPIRRVLYRGDRPGIKRLAVAPRGTTNYVEHTLETVQNRTYPLYNEVFLYMNVRPGTPLDPKLKELVRYILSQEGQEAVERDGKYLPLTAEVAREQLKKLE